MDEFFVGAGYKKSPPKRRAKTPLKDSGKSFCFILGL